MSLMFPILSDDTVIIAFSAIVEEEPTKDGSFV